MTSDSERPGGRYFFALCPSPDEARALLDAHAAGIVTLRGRGVPASGLHVTLTFVGAAIEARLTRAAARVAGHAFDICLDGHRYRRRSRMLWACASETPPALAQLVNDLRDELKVADVAFDEKPFKTHVTLLRKARARWQEASVDPVVWRCSEFVLMTSTTLPQGARYDVRGRWLLRRVGRKK